MAACRLPVEPAARELLESFEKLRQNVASVLEAAASKAQLNGEMQSAQAQLIGQGVSGVTPKNMLSGVVDLVRILTLMVLLMTSHKQRKLKISGPNSWYCMLTFTQSEHTQRTVFEEQREP